MSESASLLSPSPANGAAPAAVVATAANGQQPAAQTQSNGQAPANGHEADDQPVPQGAWYGNMVQGLDKSEALSFRNMASRYTTPQEFAKSHVELRRIAIIPPKDDKPEAWDQVFDKLGRPKDPKTYEFDFAGVELDDGEKEAAENFRTVAHREGLLPRQVKSLTRWQAEIKKTQTDAAIAKAQKLSADRYKAIQEQWGTQFDANKSYIHGAIKGNTDEAGLAFIADARLDDGTRVVNHPVFANLFAKLGSQLAEDDRDPSAFSSKASEGAVTEINRIEQEAIAKGLHPGHPLYPHAQLKPLYDRAYGTKPLPIGPVNRR